MGSALDMAEDLGSGQTASGGGSDAGQGLGRERGTELASKGAPAP